MWILSAARCLHSPSDRTDLRIVQHFWSQTKLLSATLLFVSLAKAIRRANENKRNRKNFISYGYTDLQNLWGVDGYVMHGSIHTR